MYEGRQFLEILLGLVERQLQTAPLLMLVWAPLSLVSAIEGAETVGDEFRNLSQQ